MSNLNKKPINSTKINVESRLALFQKNLTIMQTKLHDNL